jgi:hypothetical protein
MSHQFTPEELKIREEDWYQAVSDSARHGDKLLAVELALWAALMTIDALLIAVSSIFMTIVGKTGQIAIIVALILAFMSAILLYLNFNRRRSLYRTLISIPSKEAITDESKWTEYFDDLYQKNQKHAADEQTNRKCEERAVISLLVATFITFGAICGHFLCQ